MPNDNVIKYVKFSEVDLSDSFFDSLKESYQEFSEWFERKSSESAFVSYNEQNQLHGFLYLKVEEGPIVDCNPPINYPKILKIGTFKIDAHNTKLGERFVKKIYDMAIGLQLPAIYVTIFSQHTGLIALLEKYGFKSYGKKVTNNGEEEVLLKTFTELSGDVSKDYPLINATSSVQKWVLGIYDIYHTPLFPDSILKTEHPDIITDVSYTNSIHKMYIGKQYSLDPARPGDIVCIYRLEKAPNSNSKYKNVITSLCVIESIKFLNEFNSFDEFKNFVNNRSVYNEGELHDMYTERDKGYRVLSMTYNVAFLKRPIKQEIKNILASEPRYWGAFKLSDSEFKEILRLGQIYEGIVIY